jgi:hypothetical protein
MRIARLNPATNKHEIFVPQPGHAELLEDVSSEIAILTEDEKDELGSFDILAYSGACVERWWGDMVIDVSGVKHEKQTTLLLEHNDMEPIGVITRHKKGAEGLRLQGHFLSKEASPAAHKLRLQCREQAPGKPGLKLKSSVGVRFLEYRFLEKGDEPVEVNGKRYKYDEHKDTLVVEKCHLFENSVIYVNPADLGTHAVVMHGSGARNMGLENEDAKPTAPEGAKIISLASLAGGDRAALIAEAAGVLKQRDADFRKEFADMPEEWLREQIGSAKSLESVQLEHRAVLVADKKKATDEATMRNRVADHLSVLSGRDGVGFDVEGAERREAAGEVTLDGEYSDAMREAERRLHAHPFAVKFFGRDALERMVRAVKYEIVPARLRDGSRSLDVADVQIRRLAEQLWSSMPREQRAHLEKLAGGGHAGIDLAVITVKGFIDSYHEAMMKEAAWGVELMFTADSNQQSEILRWLAYWPQLQVFNEKPEEALLTAYQITWTAEWYDATVPFDIQDFYLQKFDKINKAVGQSGAVHQRHWNKLAATQIEAGATTTGYDSSNFFATSHALGGKAPATQSNDLSVANGQAFCGVPDLNNVTPSQMNTVLLNAAGYLNGYFAANGEPLNEERDRKIMVLAPVKYGPICKAAVYSDRLDGSQGGAGGSRVNPIQVDARQRGDTWEVVDTARLASASGHTADNYVYMFLVGNDRKPLIRAEPIPLQMFYAGPGSEMHRLKNQIGFWARTMRTVTVGAWSSALRIAVGT